MASSFDGLYHHRLVLKSNEVKTADAKLKQAKALYSYGDKEKAKKYLDSAQSTYESVIHKVKKGNAVPTKDKHSISFANFASKNGVKVDHSQEIETTTYGSATAVVAILNKKIDSCKALRMQWKNQTGKADYKDTLAKLQKERKDAHRKHKEEQMKGRKNMKVPDRLANESEITSFIYAMESIVEDVNTEYAMEAKLSVDTSKVEAKLNALHDAFKKARKKGDTKAMEEIKNKIATAIESLKREAAKDLKAGKKAIADRKLKKCISIGGSVLAGSGKEKNKLSTMSKHKKNIKNAVSKAKDKVPAMDKFVKTSDIVKALKKIKFKKGGFKEMKMSLESAIENEILAAKDIILECDMADAYENDPNYANAAMENVMEIGALFAGIDYMNAAIESALESFEAEESVDDFDFDLDDDFDAEESFDDFDLDLDDDFDAEESFDDLDMDDDFDDL